MDPALGILVSCAFALLFAHAAWHKWREQQRFAATLAAYRLLPGWLTAAGGYLVPSVETAIAVLLLVPRARPLAALTGTVLLLTYGLAIGVNLRRGRRDLDCGCTGPADRRPIAAWMIWRNLVLAMVLGANVAAWGDRPIGRIDALTILAGLVAIVLVYATVDRLVGQVMPRTAALRRGL
jgi:hypothetical protein